MSADFGGTNPRAVASSGPRPNEPRGFDGLASLVSVIEDTKPSSNSVAQAPISSGSSRANSFDVRARRPSEASLLFIAAAVAGFVIAFAIVSFILTYLTPAPHEPDVFSNGTALPPAHATNPRPDPPEGQGNGAKAVSSPGERPITEFKPPKGGN